MIISRGACSPPPTPLWCGNVRVDHLNHELILNIPWLLSWTQSLTPVSPQSPIRRFVRLYLIIAWLSQETSYFSVSFRAINIDCSGSHLFASMSVINLTLGNRLLNLRDWSKWQTWSRSRSWCERPFEHQTRSNRKPGTDGKDEIGIMAAIEKKGKMKMKQEMRKVEKSTLRFPRH
jgi:hypothetical protein